MSQTTCELCGGELPLYNDTIAPNRCCNLDLCDACSDGDLRKRLLDRGISLVERRWIDSIGEGDTHNMIQVTGTSTLGTSVAATFSREGLGVRIKKFFGGAKDEVQAGDTLFDQAIFVDTSTPEVTRRLLWSEGLQMVIMEAVAEYEELQIERAGPATRVIVSATWNPRSEEAPGLRMQRTVAVALHHLISATSVW